MSNGQTLRYCTVQSLYVLHNVATWTFHPVPCDTYRDVFDRARCTYRYVPPRCRKLKRSVCVPLFGEADDGKPKGRYVHCRYCNKTHSATTADEECSPGAWIDL